jgi:hypothetical protein
MPDFAFFPVSFSEAVNGYKTTWPLANAQAMMTESSARGSPMADQWTADHPCWTSSVIHSTDKFMSTTS